MHVATPIWVSWAVCRDARRTRDSFGLARRINLKCDHREMQRPWISTNLAVSIDGKISNDRFAPSGWTSSKDHSRLHALRAKADALWVGRRTLEADQMTLVVRANGEIAARQPWRIIATKSGKIDTNHRIFGSCGGPILILSGTLSTSISEMPDLKLFTDRPDLLTSDSHQGPPPVYRYVGTISEFLWFIQQKMAIRRVHCEGGGGLIGQLALLDMIDEYHVTIAGHTLFGGYSAPLPVAGTDFLPCSLDHALTDFQWDAETGECYTCYTRNRAGHSA